MPVLLCGHDEGDVNCTVKTGEGVAPALPTLGGNFVEDEEEDTSGHTSEKMKERLFLQTLFKACSRCVGSTISLTDHLNFISTI